jgi:hypothetical protein
MSSRPNPSPTLYINPATLVGLGGLLVIVILVARGFSSYSMATAALPALAFLGLALFTHLHFSMAVCAACFFSTLTLPGLPFSLDLSKGFALVVVGRVFLDFILLRKDPARPVLGGRWGYAYLVLILLTLSVRGFGLRILGSENWGGGHAIAQIIGVTAFLASNRITLPQRTLRLALRAVILLSALPMLADLLFFASGGKIFHQFYLLQFTKGGLAIPLLAEVRGIGVWRLQRALIFAPLLALWVTHAYLTRRIRGPLFTLAILFSLGLVGLSGHRIGVITLLGALGVIFVLRIPQRMSQRALVLGFMGLGFIGLLYLTAPVLPRPFQRAVSFLPGLRIDPGVKLDAAGTVNSRVQLWHRALQGFEQYAWVGRGFALNAREMTDLQTFNNFRRLRGMSPDTVEEAYLSHDYHSGPVTLLIDLGVAGLLIGGFLLLRLAIDPVRDLARRSWQHQDLRVWYLVFAGYQAINVTTFFVIYGSHSAMLIILQTAALLHLIRNADLRAETEATPAPVEKTRVRHPVLR